LLLRRIQQEADYNPRDVGREGRMLSLRYGLFTGTPALVEDLKDDIRVKLHDVGVSEGIIEAELKRAEKRLVPIEKRYEEEIRGVFQPLFNEYLRKKQLYALRPKLEKVR